MNISNSFGLKVTAKNLININHADDLSALNSISERNLLILGAGTNVILDDYFNGTIIKINLKDIKIYEDYVSVGAGVDWGDLIEFCLSNELYGIENLTHIPGSVGAAPVQNIGAYGVEISSYIISVECFNLTSEIFETLHKDECKFSYRDSIFKSKNHIIIRINFSFDKNFKPNTSYPALANFLLNNSIEATSLTPRTLSESIKKIRNSKLPDPRIEPNVGSIFKNPIVKIKDFDNDFLIDHRWDQDEGMTKLSAAKLIELIKSELNIPDTLRLHEKHSLVLVNNGGATFNEVVKLLSQIQDKISKQFNIQLIVEPEIISS
jgi:UDP-N-acetylmuramate dehydrogenase